MPRESMGTESAAQNEKLLQQVLREALREKSNWKEEIWLEERKEKSLWAKIGESSVIIGAVLIFAGFLRQYWYYHHFGIPIHQYLSLDEVLILFSMIWFTSCI